MRFLRCGWQAAISKHSIGPIVPWEHLTYWGIHIRNITGRRPPSRGPFPIAALLPI